MTIPDEVDIIVTGGGSCGYVERPGTLGGFHSLTSHSCVVAGRLANLDRNLHVMLIEAGESNLNDPWCVVLIPIETVF